ncbi:reverse transcriptase [Elysia marginata]|uniref:Reverse transcriptase n=1 Tax=Elysia marginata TaxID=1093978 RepID=A0AAV4H3C4_9GAST|nr:reverse transcriptase [Elysia marginata]
MALYCGKAKLKFSMKSILNEYKCSKARLVAVLEDCGDLVVKIIQPPVKTDRKSKRAAAIDETKECTKAQDERGIWPNLD